jgi:hypothetical protein
MDLDTVLDGGDCFRMAAAYEKGPGTHGLWNGQEGTEAQMKKCRA